MREEDETPQQRLLKAVSVADDAVALVIII